MKNMKLIASAIVALFLIESCSEESISPFYNEGILVVNEGNYGSPSASISYTSNDFSQEEKNVVEKANPNQTLGDVAQDLGVKAENVFVVLNNSNKVEVFNRYNFKKTTTFSDQLTHPRYINFSNNKIYVTNNQSVSVFNSSYVFVRKINLNKTAERIEEAGNKLWVQNAAYGTGNSITIINPTTDEVISSISLPNTGLQKIVGKGNYLYAITGNSTKSELYEIDATNGSISRSITLGTIKNATNLCVDETDFYFSSDEKIYKMARNTNTIPTAPFLSVVANNFSTLYGMDVINGRIYTSDAQGFRANSVISVFSTNTGSLIKSFSTGIGSNKFVYNP